MSSRAPREAFTERKDVHMSVTVNGEPGEAKKTAGRQSSGDASGSVVLGAEGGTLAVTDDGISAQSDDSQSDVDGRGGLLLAGTGRGTLVRLLPDDGPESLAPRWARTAVTPDVVVGALEEISTAVLAVDRPRLEAVVADDCVGVNTLGSVFDRTGYIDGHIDPAQAFTRYEQTLYLRYVAGRFALVRGNHSGDTPHGAADARFLALLQCDPDQVWRLRYWQESAYRGMGKRGPTESPPGTPPDLGDLPMLVRTVVTVPTPGAATVRVARGQLSPNEDAYAAWTPESGCLAVAAYGPGAHGDDDDGLVVSQWAPDPPDDATAAGATYRLAADHPGVDAPSRTIKALLGELSRAIEACDADAVEALLHRDYRAGGFTGLVIDRAGFIQIHANPAQPIGRFALHPETIVGGPGLALAYGRSRVEGANGTVQARFAAAWVFDRQWRLLAWQETQLPDDDTPSSTPPITYGDSS